MLDHKDYLETLNKARRKRNRRWDPRYLLMILGAVVLIGIVAALAMSLKKPASGRAAGEPGQEAGPGPGATPAQAAEPTLSQEEKERQEQQAAIDEVVNSYQNLGLVQVSGYLNIRETPSLDGKIIGKLSGDAGCEILETDGEWSHITSGGVDGYINNQYLLTGDEAKSKAKELVKLRAIVTTDNLNIRKEPALDPNNVIGQALLNERYVVLGQQDGWIQIEEGYISADYAEVKYALNEGRKMDLKAMAINQYDNLVISKVNNYLNVRAEPKSDGKIIGKMTSKAAGEILESLDGWYKIKSGPITGYITADPQYTATGQEAKDIAMQTATLKAVINTDVLNVRTEPNTDAKIWTQIVKDERYPVLAQLDGWVQIELDSVDEEDGSEGDKAYISTRDNNVEVRYALNEAIKFSPAEEAANAAASRRSKVVNYALQFVGNPYVWGGTSLTKGADCSGFTMQVMRQFGVSLPHYSGAQAKMGKPVKSSEMRPGDLIFYANSGGTVNHVAMYIGNGQIVHAASKKSGIKISTWNYRTPVAIRNVLGD
ncbi:C40 family peptidase [Enterocloster asparagiformis]|uniref:SH3 domain protein n=3 Tax=Enterocloster asparagiformis TaxID=333367 RepID=C0D984_9FIRM|nr:C40 family peptidase [Enterocloster asparagiformis]EEG52102.1 SH3 domain protein [[Clostridium] asparagiforme DSM 15981]RGX31468.1 hydrolase Nlp/P60 [Enterocloster asparagiformis]UWO74494.1 SH3 domain-containing protein [[Clostridium] asparagiforme DSM 15981]